MPSRSLIKFPAYDTQIKIYHAFLDQRLHGLTSTPDTPGWSIKIFKETTEKYFPLGYTPQTSYYLHFPHLSGYGGVTTLTFGQGLLPL